MKQLIITMAMLFLLPFFPSDKQPNENPVSMRALLIGGDTFLTQEPTFPIAKNNTYHFRDLLQTDARTYDSIFLYYEEIGTSAALETAVNHIFSDADENDISLIYFSTHGTMTDDQAVIFLCDGEEELLLTPEALAPFLSSIPGYKILILDTCNSGAFIQKGIDSLQVRHAFTGKDIYIITSAGGCEASWQWQNREPGAAGGESYFSSLLIGGLAGHRAADINHDYTVTINEAFMYLSESCASSSPQRYPSDTANFPLYVYTSDAPAAQPAISGLTFEDVLLTADQSDVSFSFTVHWPTTLYYQLVYYTNGHWDFENAAFLQDVQDGQDLLSPGRKMRKLQLDTQQHTESGYVMIQLFTMDENIPVYIGGRTLCVQPTGGALQLSVDTAPVFRPEEGEEMPILISHDMPCSLSITIRNDTGKVVRRLSYAQPTKPMQLPSPGTTFYWNGRNNQDQPCQAGLYYIQVQADLGNTRHTIESDYFRLEITSEVE